MQSYGDSRKHVVKGDLNDGDSDTFRYKRSLVYGDEATLVIVM